MRVFKKEREGEARRQKIALKEKKQKDQENFSIKQYTNQLETAPTIRGNSRVGMRSRN